jgi:hypothetical protein
MTHIYVVRAAKVNCGLCSATRREPSYSESRVGTPGGAGYELGQMNALAAIDVTCPIWGENLHQSKLQSFGQMIDAQRVGAGKIGDRARHLADPIVPARTECHFDDGGVQ